MRDIAVTLAVFSTLPFILKRPWIGILVWAWLGYMNPHRLTWGFAYSFPFAMIIALTTLTALLISKEKKEIPWTRETILLLFMIAWFFMTTVYSLYPWLAWPQWDKVWKVMLMTYVTMMLINDEYRLKALMFVIALSLGFYGFKGGIFVVTGGSAHSVMGPMGSFIGDRNSIGLALIMVVPLLNFMRMHFDRAFVNDLPVVRYMISAWVVRWGLLAGIGLTLIAIVGTHSRGALVGLVCMTFFYLIKARQKFAAMLSLIPVVFVLYSVMPDEYFARMETITSWEEDGSASERVRAWNNAIDLANTRFIGGGMRALVHWGGRDSHSIYFGILGEHGWVGLTMFMLLLLFTWRSGSWIIRNTRKIKELYWARDLAAMVQVSLVGYMAAGAFLGLQYFDLFYHLVAITVMARCIVTRKLQDMERAGAAVRPLAEQGATASGPGEVSTAGPPGMQWR
jgi:probable O-glycosylation ligase (exosortase A-associated)